MKHDKQDAHSEQPRTSACTVAGETPEPVAGECALDVVLDNVPDGITVVDAVTGRVTMESRFARALTGRSPDIEISIPLGEYANLLRLVHADGTPVAAEDMPLARAMSQGVLVINEQCCMERSDGTRTPILCSAAPIRDRQGAIVGGVAAWRDIGELLEARERLEAQIVEDTRQLSLLNRRLHELDCMKSGLLHMATHELRNPLAILLGYNALVREGACGPLNPEQQECLTREAEAAQSLLGIIDCLLEISRLDAGLVHFKEEPVLLPLIVRQTVDAMTGALAAADIQVALDLGACESVPSDSKRVAQILVELLGNACKSARGSRITISCGSVGDQMGLRVSDTGPGVPVEVIERVFGTSDTELAPRYWPGTGLGLYLCRRLAEALGGTLAVESRPGHGSTFTLHLPLVGVSTCRQRGIE